MAKTKASRAGPRPAVTGKRHTRKPGRAPRRGRKCASRRRRHGTANRRRRRHGGDGDGAPVEYISGIDEKISLLSKINDARHSIYDVLKKMVKNEPIEELDGFDGTITNKVSLLVNQAGNVASISKNPTETGMSDLPKLKKELRDTAVTNIKNCGVLIVDTFRDLKTYIETKVGAGKLSADGQKKIIDSIAALTPLLDDPALTGLIDVVTIKGSLDAIGKLDVITKPPPSPSMFSGWL